MNKAENVTQADLTVARGFDLSANCQEERLYGRDKALFMSQMRAAADIADYRARCVAEAVALDRRGDQRVADERERCAKIIEGYSVRIIGANSEQRLTFETLAADIREMCLAAIRGAEGEGANG